MYTHATQSMFQGVPENLQPAGLPSMVVGTGDNMQGTDFSYDPQVMAVHHFIQRMELDERASRTLLNAHPRVQQDVMAMSEMKNLENKSAALMMRINIAQERLGLAP